MREPSEGSKTTTADALIGLLSLGPMSGYEMRKLIDESIGNFWSESYGQIYPTLKRLVAEGMVTCKTEQAKGRPARKVYTLTEEGRRRVQDWLRLPVQERPPRNELLLKVFFSGFASISALEMQLQAFRAAAQLRLEQYAGIAAETKRRYPAHPHLPYWLMTLDYGMTEARAHSEWCDRALAQCEELKRQHGPTLVKGPVKERQP